MTLAPARLSGVRVLAGPEVGALRDLVERDPLACAGVACRLDIPPARRGGVFFGSYTAGALTGACFAGGTVLPVGDDPAAWLSLADHLALAPRACSSIVGRADAVSAMTDAVSSRWGRPRLVRADQPLLVIDHVPAGARLPLTLVGVSELDRYLPAAVEMFTQELGASPLTGAGRLGYRSRIVGLLAAGRASALFDSDGVVAKAEIGLVTEETAQVQGVWVRPSLRGRGIGAAAMRSVLAWGLTLAPTVSLYVNDFNVPARALYDRLGMREVATLSTVMW